VSEGEMRRRRRRRKGSQEERRDGLHSEDGGRTSLQWRSKTTKRKVTGRLRTRRVPNFSLLFLDPPPFPQISNPSAP